MDGEVYCEIDAETYILMKERNQLLKRIAEALEKLGES